MVFVPQQLEFHYFCCPLCHLDVTDFSGDRQYGWIGEKHYGRGGVIDRRLRLASVVLAVLGRPVLIQGMGA